MSYQQTVDTLQAWEIDTLCKIYALPSPDQKGHIVEPSLLHIMELAARTHRLAEEKRARQARFLDEWNDAWHKAGREWNDAWHKAGREWNDWPED